jgi:hypothetical protein
VMGAECFGQKIVIAHPAERWDGGFQIGVSEGLIFG